MRSRIIVYLFALISLLYLSPSGNCEISREQLFELGLQSPIAVEKLTGRGEEYEISFSGWVGSFNLRLEENRIYIAEFSEFDSGIHVLVGIYEITRVEKFNTNIDFDCVDAELGLEWNGKIWLDDNLKVRLEMIQKISPRRWVNLGKHGRKYLKEIQNRPLNLGLTIE